MQSLDDLNKALELAVNSYLVENGYPPALFLQPTDVSRFLEKNEWLSYEVPTTETAKGNFFINVQYHSEIHRVSLVGDFLSICDITPRDNWSSRAGGLVRYNEKLDPEQVRSMRGIAAVLAIKKGFAK